MTLTYDFDIFDVIPASESGDNLLKGLLGQNGPQLPQEAATIALFRDERTADALSTGPQALRDYFLASGFGLNTYDSGAPRGFYPAKDEEARLDVIRRLTQNAGAFDLPTAQDDPEGGDAFNFSAFLQELAQAQPIAMDSNAIQDGETDTCTLQLPAGLPRYFETDRLSPALDSAEAAPPPPPKLWLNRMVRIAAAAGLVAGAAHLLGGPAITVLASL